MTRYGATLALPRRRVHLTSLFFFSLNSRSLSRLSSLYFSLPLDFFDLLEPKPDVFNVVTQLSPKPPDEPSPEDFLKGISDLSLVNGII